MRVRALVLGGAALALAPLPAWAHAPIEGIGEFYSGMLHPLRVPAHALTLVAVGLMASQGGTERFPLIGATFVVSLLVGLGVGAIGGAIGGPVADVEPVLLGLAGLIGVCVAAAWQPPRLAGAALVGAAGLAVGLDSLPEVLTRQSDLLMLGGTVLAVFLIPLWIAGAAIGATRQWQRVGVRVVGSWTAAAALMVLALAWSRDDLGGAS